MRRRSNRPNPRLLRHDPSKSLADPDRVMKAFARCMSEGDHEAAVEVLAAGLRHLNKSMLARRYDIPRRTAYNLLSKKTVPGLDLIAKVCRAIHAEFHS